MFLSVLRETFPADVSANQKTGFVDAPRNGFTARLQNHQGNKYAAVEAQPVTVDSGKAAECRAKTNPVIESSLKFRAETDPKEGADFFRPPFRWQWIARERLPVPAELRL